MNCVFFALMGKTRKCKQVEFIVSSNFAKETAQDSVFVCCFLNLAGTVCFCPRRVRGFDANKNPRFDLAFTVKPLVLVSNFLCRPCIDVGECTMHASFGWISFILFDVSVWRSRQVLGAR